MSDAVENRDKILSVQVFMVLGALLLLGQAFYLQLVNTAFKSRAQAIAIDKSTTYPSRGVIFDRNGKLLITNTPMYDIMVNYKQVNPDMDTTMFCKLLEIDKATFLKNLNKNWKDPRFSKSVPYVFLSKLSTTAYAKFQEHLFEFPGFFPVLRNIRGYPQPNAAHLLGYISEVNQKNIDESDGIYSPGDYIGASGLEKQYESYLRGKKGYKYQLKDNLGRIVGSYKDGEKNIDAESGSDLYTSIDIDLQAYGEGLMAGKTGSIVAIDPQTGEILTMISSPTYDPNRLVITRERGDVMMDLLKDPDKPFFDRSVQAKYPPGSIFKTLVALAALEGGQTRHHKGYDCNEGYVYKGKKYGCHRHSRIKNIEDAIQHSCNTYFWKTIQRIIDQYSFYNPQKGLDRFVEQVEEFGLGHPLGIDFPNESAGNIPTSAYYDKVYPKNLGGWKSPTVMSIGIGQGEIQMTSIQMANLAAIIANRGYYYTPHLVRRISNNQPIDSVYTQRHQVNIKKEYFDWVIDGMEDAVRAGTATLARTDDLTICGKTGTSQNPHGKDHSVFFAFGPKDNPQIAIAVYVENAGWGGSFAAPIASLMMEKYVVGEVPESRKWLEKQMLEAVITKEEAE